MRLKRRQYVLIILIIVVGAFNFFRIRRARMEAVPAPTAPATAAAPGTSPAWPLFDKAAALRDAPNEQLAPALQALDAGIGSANATAVPPQASVAELADLHGCQTWLLFYRQEHLHPTNKPGWLGETQQHVDSCVAQHRDIAR